MKNIMIMGFLALMAGHVSANNQQEANAAEEKVLTPKEIVNVQKNSTDETKDLLEEVKPLEMPEKKTDKNS